VVVYGLVFDDDKGAGARVLWGFLRANVHRVRIGTPTTKCSFSIGVGIAPMHVCTNEVRGAAGDDRVPLVEMALSAGVGESMGCGSDDSRGLLHLDE
jgi:hypothetical protein